MATFPPRLCPIRFVFREAVEQGKHILGHLGVAHTLCMRRIAVNELVYAEYQSGPFVGKVGLAAIKSRRLRL